MIIEHHPSDELLSGFAAGGLDHGQHIAMATHLFSCAQCRAAVRDFERVGGAVLSDLAPAPMSEQAFAAVEARLSEKPMPRAAVAPPSVPETEVPGLPAFVRRYPFRKWTWIAPSVHLRPIELPHPSESRVFLLKSGPGTKMLQHTHTGFEMTCVLSGAFRQAGSRFGAGDFDFGDKTIDHRPIVEEGEDCICLVAMHGGLELRGLLGKLVQPFVRL
jgi:putative transcriptional regulator